MAVIPSACLLFILLNLLLGVNIARSEPFLGVNYGQLADNLPSPSDTVKLLQSTSIQKIRLYGPNIPLIKALANTGIEIVVGAANGEIPALASDPNAARAWITTNVVPYYPASDIILIMVGNEISTDDNLRKQLLPAMQNMQNALNSVALDAKIRISTVHSMAVLGMSEPPSKGSFRAGLVDAMKGFLGFNNATGSPFAINPYPYFAYKSDNRPETLAFCLFQPNAGRYDPYTKIRYMNMFDAQVDAVRSALNSLGYNNVDIVVAETGWPYKGDDKEVGPSYDNAKAYNGGLIFHLRSKAGSPLMQGKSVDTYLFALYDENLKPGASSERAFGLFKPDGTATYDVGLLKSSQGQGSNGEWCVPKAGVTDVQLQANLDYACGKGGIDCGPIQPGGACFEPNTLLSHATYAMNLLYQTNGKHAWDCDFSKTATLSSKNPSYNGCT
ncbi:putative Glucan endo-1,3-beta-glucosidase [Melia azedarach]|uniref:Glucan endo-1,3-beta-glucosidase n=1 Tax=Melia azedarach TaxID=155640 RepID=A0ACC1WSR4_MELAZ|nr:putative Glucan endo-1,3-beta-glucosidase [Melia azedarach]